MFFCCCNIFLESARSDVADENSCRIVSSEEKGGRKKVERKNGKMKKKLGHRDKLSSRDNDDFVRHCNDHWNNSDHY